MEDNDLKITKKENIKVRVRFAPSPTGLLHLGGARTALFNYIFAQKYNGDFILRIEDSNIKLSKLEYKNDILNSLKWLGIEWQEGPDIGGKYGPYEQSKRLNIYQKNIQQLLKENKAYHCFCSEEELETQRQYQMSIGEAPHYIGKCRELPEKIIKQYLSQKKKSVIRFKVVPKIIIFNDLVRGKLKFDTSLMGDIIIARPISPADKIASGRVKNLPPFIPLYNFALVVDDFEMKISHVIRGEDHISNTPIQILIQEALQFPRPQYAHLPLILGPDKSKLSKRHGAISINEYRKKGYLPETLINFLAFLGWNPGTEKEIFSKHSLIQEFSLKRIQKGGAIFNIKKLDYLNGFYIRSKSSKKLTELCLPYLIKNKFIEEVKITNSGKKFKIRETGEIIDFEWLNKIIELEQSRIKKLSEISCLVDFFFQNKLKYNRELLRWRNMSDREIIQALKKLEKILSKIKSENFNKKSLEKKLILEENKKSLFSIIRKKLFRNKKIGDRGRLLWPLRVALTGKQASPGPFEIAEILGKEKTLEKIKQAYNLFN